LHRDDAVEHLLLIGVVLELGLALLDGLCLVAHALAADLRHLVERLFALITAAAADEQRGDHDVVQHSPTLTQYWPGGGFWTSIVGVPLSILPVSVNVASL